MNRGLRTTVSLVFGALFLFGAADHVLAKGGGRGGGGGKGGTVNVRPYTKKDGTYVAPHHRTSPTVQRATTGQRRGTPTPIQANLVRRSPEALF
jgi:hypothetical protein